MNIELLAVGLTADGYQILTATSGAQALSLAALSPPDLVLLDILLGGGGMDGYETCRVFKNHPRLREIPIIFVSALYETTDKVKGFEAGGVDYLTKPLDFEEVLIRVKTHLTLRRQQKQIEALLKLREAAEVAERQQRVTLAIIEERQRLAQELHDSISQTLFSANALAEVLPRIIDSNPVAARRYMVELAQFTREAMVEMRTLLFELRPDSVNGVELHHLLKQLCDIFTFKKNIAVGFHAVEHIVLPHRQQSVVYRIALETLNNIAKYAKPSSVTLSLHREPEQVVLTIWDNGRSFDKALTVMARRELDALCENVQSIGAELVISNEPPPEMQVMLKVKTDDRSDSDRSH